MPGTWIPARWGGDGSIHHRDLVADATGQPRHAWVRLALDAFCDGPGFLNESGKIDSRVSTADASADSLARIPYGRVSVFEPDGQNSLQERVEMDGLTIFVMLTISSQQLDESLRKET